MKCKKCGSELWNETETLYCVFCGAKIEKACGKVEKSCIDFNIVYASPSRMGFRRKTSNESAYPMNYADTDDESIMNTLYGSPEINQKVMDAIKNQIEKLDIEDN